MSIERESARCQLVVSLRAWWPAATSRCWFIVFDYAVDDGLEITAGYRMFTRVLDPAVVSTVDLAATYTQHWKIELPS